MVRLSTLALLGTKVLGSDVKSCDSLDEASMLQMPVAQKTLHADEATAECRCPGYYQEQCVAEAAQGCIWSSAGTSNSPWCQCDESVVAPPFIPGPTVEPLPPVTAPPVTAAPVTAAPEPAQCFGTHEAEVATIVGAVVHANTASQDHAGFSGSSFVDYLHPDTDYIEWSVPSCSGGPAQASFRYALSGGNRPLQLLVNGHELTAQLSFPATLSWASWGLASVVVPLTEGTNTVRLVATGASGANMDALILSPVEDLCDESQWPDLDHGLVCSDCKVLVNRFNSFYGTCNGYCERMGRACAGAWEETGDTCTVLHDMTCDQELAGSSDAICQCSAEVTLEPEDPTDPEEDLCDESQWPDLDHGLVCSDCKVLVNRFNSHYGTCNGYCETMNRACAGAWEETGDTCTVLHDMTCDQELAGSSDAICQCSAEVVPVEPRFIRIGDSAIYWEDAGVKYWVSSCSLCDAASSPRPCDGFIDVAQSYGDALATGGGFPGSTDGARFQCSQHPLYEPVAPVEPRFIRIGDSAIYWEAADVKYWVSSCSLCDAASSPRPCDGFIDVEQSYGDALATGGGFPGSTDGARFQCSQHPLYEPPPPVEPRFIRIGDHAIYWEAADVKYWVSSCSLCDDASSPRPCNGFISVEQSYGDALATGEAFQCSQHPLYEPVAPEVIVEEPLVFHLAPGGAATCDRGTPLESGACLDAVTQLAANTGASLGRAALQQGSGGGCLDGSWGQVPGGCSAQSGGDWAAHYKSGSALGDDCVHAAYQLVCTGAPFPEPCVIRNSHSDRRLYAQRGESHENGVGADDGQTTHEDQTWIINDAGDGAYTVTNSHSGRRLFAQGGRSHEDGVGAGNGVTTWADQKWYIEATGDGKYIFRNYHSGRRLFAQSDHTGGEGVGASDGNTVFADQKWYIEAA